MRFISYAQNGEDVLLNRVFAGVTKGFYVDIGAYDPVEGSVTKAFSDRGWTGINIEPGAVFDRLAVARPRDVNLRVAVLDRSGTVAFVQHAVDAGMSHINQRPEPAADGVIHEVPCDTLTAILATHAPGRAVDFLKIDAEGAEGAIVGSTNWCTIRPTVLVIEATRPWSNELTNSDWEPVLFAFGYRRVWFDGINCFYVPEERDDLFRHFALPINVLDDWIPFDCARVKLEAERELIDAELQAVREELRQTDAKSEVTNRELEIIKAERESLDAELQAVREELKRTGAKSEVTNRELEIIKAERESLDVELKAAQERLRKAEVTVDTHSGLLNQITYELRWPNGPRALRIVLPIARLIRRLASAPAPLSNAHDCTDPGSTTAKMQSLPLLGAPGEPARLKKIAKKLLLIFYRLVRPILRPIAWRTRTFLTHEVRFELARLEAKIDRLAATPPTSEGTVEMTRLEAKIDKLAAAPPASEGPATGPIATVDMGELTRMMETTLLTLALGLHRDGS